MKAAVYRRYGPPDVVVQTEEVEKPVPKENEVLIEVRAASVNALDGALMKGRPYIARIVTGLRKPNITRLGVDVAGQVEAVGRNVMQFKPGDQVFGSCIRDPQASGVKIWDCRGPLPTMCVLPSRHWL
jgi:NADPH:quinone reductase-like Zn-dependent oxidoreductase